jgi:hypothetical protein
MRLVWLLMGRESVAGNRRTMAELARDSIVLLFLSSAAL